MWCRVISYGYDKTTFAPSIFNFFAKISKTGSAILSFSALIKYYTHAKLTIETYEYDTVMLPNNLNLQQNDHSCVFLFFYISGKSTIELSRFAVRCSSAKTDDCHVYMHFIHSNRDVTLS